MTQSGTRSAARVIQPQEAFVVGLVATSVLVGVQYIAKAMLHLPFVPRASAELFSDSPSVPLVTLMLLIFVLAGGALGALYSQIRLPGNGLLSGFALGIVALLLTLPLGAAGHWGLAAPLPGAIGLLASYALWGWMLDQSLQGAAVRPATTPDSDSPMLTRRMFLVQTAAGGLLIMLLSLPTAWLLEGRPLLPPITLFWPAPPPTPTPEFFQVPRL